MCQWFSVEKIRISAVNNVLIMVLVTCSHTVTTIFKNLSAFQSGALQRFQRVPVRIVTIIRHVGGRRTY